MAEAGGDDSGGIAERVASTLDRIGREVRRCGQAGRLDDRRRWETWHEIIVSAWGRYRRIAGGAHDDWHIGRSWWLERLEGHLAEAEAALDRWGEASGQMAPTDGGHP